MFDPNFIQNDILFEYGVSLVGLRLVGGPWRGRAAAELVAAGIAHTRTGCSPSRTGSLMDPILLWLAHFFLAA